jgi:phosphoenolpyruvate carboxykinase (ATP)
MSTKANYRLDEIGAGKVGFPKTGEAVTNTRAIVEAAFYGNNVVKVNTLKEA